MGNISTLDGTVMDIAERVITFTNPEEIDGFAFAEAVLTPKPKRIRYVVRDEVVQTLYEFKSSRS